MSVSCAHLSSASLYCTLPIVYSQMVRSASAPVGSVSSSYKTSIIMCGVAKSYATIMFFRRAFWRSSNTDNKDVEHSVLYHCNDSECSENMGKLQPE